MKYLIFFILLTNCTMRDLELNPYTTVIKQMIKVKNDYTSN